VFRKNWMISGIPGIELQHYQSSGFMRGHGRYLPPDEETLTRSEGTVKLEVFCIVHLREQEFPWEIIGLKIFRNPPANLPRQGHSQHRRRNDAFRCFVMEVAGIAITHGSGIIHGLPRIFSHNRPD
jgi:hypothetical protein